MSIKSCYKIVCGSRVSLRVALLLVLIGFVTVPSQAQTLTQGLNAFSSATEGVAPYVGYVRNLCYVLAGCMSIVGACGAYCQMISEHGSIKKPIVSSVAACLMLICLGTALPEFFGISSESATSGVVSDNSGYLDGNGKFRYDDWYAEQAPLSGWEVMNGEVTIAPAYRGGWLD